MIVLSLVLFVVGLFILSKGADWLVDGASSLALKLKITPIVIGLTVVAFGTSAPELVVSLTSALNNNTAIAVGNIVGSNIANILLILGVTATIYPLTVKKNTVWKEIPMSFLGAVMLLILGVQHILDARTFPSFNLNSPEQAGIITFTNGLVFLAFFIIFLYYTFGISKASGDNESEIKTYSGAKSAILIVGGLIVLGLGSKLVVDNAIAIARTFGLSDALIGLTIVAIGTSLPELVTSVKAALKKNSDIAVGNIVGSNIFNILFILGLTALFKDIPLSGQNVADILVLFATTILLIVTLFVWKKHTITRIQGLFMIACYVAYISFLVIRG